jgi:hypothetical protein
VRRVIKAIAIGVIALVIPVQGMAAIAMSFCAPANPAGLAGVAGHASDADVVAGPALHQHAAPKHATHSDHEAGKASGNPVGESDHSGHSMLKCCSAACAMVAALPAGTVAARTLTGSQAPRRPLAQFYSSATPDGLDRPPKFFLA